MIISTKRIVAIGMTIYAIAVFYNISLIRHIHSNANGRDAGLKENALAKSKQNTTAHTGNYNNDKEGERLLVPLPLPLPSAKWLLKSKPPFEDADIIKL